MTYRTALRSSTSRPNRATALGPTQVRETIAANAEVKHGERTPRTLRRSARKSVQRCCCSTHPCPSTIESPTIATAADGAPAPHQFRSDSTSDRPGASAELHRRKLITRRKGSWLRASRDDPSAALAARKMDRHSERGEPRHVHRNWVGEIFAPAEIVTADAPLNVTLRSVGRSMRCKSGDMARAMCTPVIVSGAPPKTFEI